MSDYQFTPRAKSDLLEIAAAISRHSRKSAARVIRSIRTTCQDVVAKHPEVGQRCDDLAPGLRCFSVGNYAVFFRSENPVQIIRVLHGARDIESLFRKPHED